MVREGNSLTGLESEIHFNDNANPVELKNGVLVLGAKIADIEEDSIYAFTGEIN